MKVEIFVAEIGGEVPSRLGGTAERSGAEVPAQRRGEAQAEHRAGVDVPTRPDTAEDQGRIYRPVLGDKDAVEHQRVARRPPEGTGVPFLGDGVLGPGHDGPAHERRLLWSAGRSHQAHHGPAAMRRSARVRPTAADLVAPLHRHHRALAGRERRRHHGRRIRSPHFVLHLFAEDRDQPEVAGQETEDPSGRAVTFGHLADQLDDGGLPELVATPARRLVHAQEIRRHEVLDGLVGQAARGVALPAAAPDPIGQPLGPLPGLVQGEAGRLGPLHEHRPRRATLVGRRTHAASSR